MKRKHFILLSAIIAWLFSLTMIFTPDQMMSTMGLETTAALNLFTQFLGVNLFSIGVINFISRNDPGSIALRAVMTGNIVLHVLGISFDWYGYGKGLLNVNGIIMGTIVHSLLIIGFVYYFVQSKKAA